LHLNIFFHEKDKISNFIFFWEYSNFDHFLHLNIFFQNIQNISFLPYSDMPKLEKIEQQQQYHSQENG